MSAADDTQRDAATSDDDGRHDFDFFHGSWTVAHRRLKHRLAGSTDWDTFAGTSTCWPLLGGLANVDDNHMPAHIVSGLTLRLFDPAQRLWSIRWANARDLVLGPPLVGRFEKGAGVFHGDDVAAGIPVKVKFRWTVLSADAAHWEQAFSADAGGTWETNWTMRFSRAAPARG